MELYAFGDGYIADTPGFSAVELERYEVIRKEELAGCFSEFAQYSKACKFTGCSHTVEKGCAVLEAVRAGLVHPSRHTSYCVMYELSLIHISRACDAGKYGISCAGRAWRRAGRFAGRRPDVCGSAHRSARTAFKARAPVW